MNITIVGGGTAGWLAALMLKKISPMHEIKIIDSSKVGIIGAGESSTGELRGIITNEVWNFGCDEADFFKSTNATPKYAILHRNWNGDNTEYIAPTDSLIDDPYSGTNCLLNAYISKKSPMQHASINGRLVDNKLTSFYLENNELKSIERHAYNFDARLAAKYLEKVCGNDVEKIDAVVVDIKINGEGYINSLILDNGQEIFADFFIDASGFSKLISKKMGIKWVDYVDLTLNTAMPFILPCDDTIDIKFLATSWAQKYGWMWMVPKATELGCGYVFDDRFTNVEDAQTEIERVLRRVIKPIKIIKFSPGRLETVWNKNVLSIGLAASFLEPLEATSIHATICQLNSFIFTHLKENIERTINPNDIKIYNQNMSAMFDNFKNFLVLHYVTKRTDTEFWIQSRHLAENNGEIKSILEIIKNRLINKSDISTGIGYANTELYNWILCGLGHYDSETAKKEISILNRLEIAKRQEKQLSDFMREFDWLSNKKFLEIIHQLS